MVRIFAIITFLIVMYDIIQILNALIPSYGMLIHTFTVARKDILIFLCVGGEWGMTLCAVHQFDFDKFHDHWQHSVWYP
jgi:hypothetical protein